MQDDNSLAAVRPHDARQRSPTRKTPREQLSTFEIKADHCPQVLLRILGLMTRDGSIPVTVAVTRAPDAIVMTIELDGATPARCKQLRTRIEELPTVHRASLSVFEDRQQRPPPRD